MFRYKDEDKYFISDEEFSRKLESVDIPAVPGLHNENDVWISKERILKRRKKDLWIETTDKSKPFSSMLIKGCFGKHCCIIFIIWFYSCIIYSKKSSSGTCQPVSQPLIKQFPRKSPIKMSDVITRSDRPLMNGCYMDLRQLASLKLRFWCLAQSSNLKIWFTKKSWTSFLSRPSASRRSSRSRRRTKTLWTMRIRLKGPLLLLTMEKKLTCLWFQVIN